MSEETQTLRLFKYNTMTDGNQLFSINTSLNDNWDKIDNFAEITNSSKQDISNLVTSLTTESTDSQYPSAKCVYDTNSSKQDKSNLVTSLSSESTDSQYPSAKCVYDIIGNVEALLSEI